MVRKLSTYSQSAVRGKNTRVFDGLRLQMLQELPMMCFFLMIFV